jgi:hypothetical protein
MLYWAVAVMVEAGGHHVEPGQKEEEVEQKVVTPSERGQRSYYRHGFHS